MKLQGRFLAAIAPIAMFMAFVLFAGCGGSGSVSTTPVPGVIPGSATTTLSVATSGGYATLPTVSGIGGTVLVPPAVGAASPVSTTVTLSTTQPSNLPTPPLPALAYVTFKPMERSPRSAPALLRSQQSARPWLAPVRATPPVCRSSRRQRQA